MEPVPRSGMWGGVEEFSRGGEEWEIGKTRGNEVRNLRRAFTSPVTQPCVHVCVRVKAIIKWTKIILSLEAC